jgi:hypothetical protein
MNVEIGTEARNFFSGIFVAVCYRLVLDHAGEMQATKGQDCNHLIRKGS